MHNLLVLFILTEYLCKAALRKYYVLKRKKQYRPWARFDKAIGTEQILSAVLSLSAIWIPPLTCLSTFWFPQDEQLSPRNKKVANERIYGALTFTVTYLLFVFGMIIWVIYVVDYYPDAKQLPPVGASFQNCLDYAVKIALITSPLALALIGWLTASRSIKVK